MKHKMKWVGKYISRPILLIILIIVCLRYFNPKLLDSWGINDATLGKYAFYFFALKGLMWIVVFSYGFLYIKNKRNNKP